MKIGTDEFDKLAIGQLDMLFRLARRWTGDPSRTEDLVQETYLRALRARNEFKLQQCGIRPWLVRIMHNAYITRWQRELRQPIVVDESHLDQAVQRKLPSALDLNPVSFDGMDEQLVRAIEDLPEEYKTALLLWAIEDFSYREIAAATEVPIGTVMSRLHRARARLSERLRDFALKERIIRE